MRRYMKVDEAEETVRWEAREHKVRSEAEAYTGPIFSST